MSERAAPEVTVNRVIADGTVDLVMFQADCDDCGWHTRQALPKRWVNEMARRHRLTCPWTNRA